MHDKICIYSSLYVMKDEDISDVVLRSCDCADQADMTGVVEWCESYLGLLVLFWTTWDLLLVSVATQCQCTQSP